MLIECRQVRWCAPTEAGTKKTHPHGTATVHLVRMAALLLTLGWTALFLWVVWRWRWFHAEGLRPWQLPAVLLLKIAAGMALWAIYTWYYTSRADSDIYKFFDDGNVLFSALASDRPSDYLSMLLGTAQHDPVIDERYYRAMHNWYRQYEGPVFNDAHTMIRFNALVRLVSFGHYPVHTVFACFVGLVGSMGLYKAFLPHLRHASAALFAAVFLLPSVVFWSSGVLKECVLLLGLGLFVHGLLGIAARRWSWSHVGTFVMGLWLLTLIKVYVLGSLLPASVALMWCGITRREGVGWRYATVFVLATLAAGMLHWPGSGTGMLDVLRVKQQDFIGVATSTEAGSRIPLPLLDGTARSFIRTAPHALFVTFIAPFLAVRNGLLGMLGAAENLLLPMAMLFAWRYRRPWSEVPWALVLFCAGYVLVLALVMGWTTPVLGALVRYRVPLLPFFFIGLLLLTDPRRPLRTSILP